MISMAQILPRYIYATVLSLETTTKILSYYRFVLNEMVCEFLITISF